MHFRNSSYICHKSVYSKSYIVLIVLLTLLKDSQFPFITGDIPNLTFGSQLRPVEFKYISFLSLFWKPSVALCLTVCKSLHSWGELPCNFCLYARHTPVRLILMAVGGILLSLAKMCIHCLWRLSWILPHIPSAPS